MLTKILLLFLLFLFFKPFVGTISAAAIVAIVLYPLYSRIRRRWFAAFLVIAFTLLLVYLAYISSIFFYGQLIKLADFYSSLDPQYKAPIIKASENIPVADFAKQFISAVPSIVVRFPLFFFLVYFFLVDGQKLKEYFTKVFPEKGEKISERVWKNANAIINGIFVNALVFSLFGTAVLYYVGSSNPLLYAVAAAFIGILPLIGSWMIYAYACYELFLAGNYAGIAVVAVFLILWSIFGDTYFKMRYRGDLHPGVVLASIFAGIHFFGFPGVLTGPVIVTVIGELVEG